LSHEDAKLIVGLPLDLSSVLTRSHLHNSSI